ncbi:MAG TPA: helix-turn-helix transcriptional regulator, partial [Defluviicoccus sp.]|nr:helix-turn-helix transcriptional regulator [Defluviicoccus sp.]
PVGGAWEDVNFPEIGDPHAYALEISGDSMEPVYRDGDIVIVCPQANVRRGDRVVVKTKAGEVMAKMLKRQTAHKLELKSLNPEHPDLVFSDEEVDWVARILWASQ